ncbi:transcriptional regulator [Arthrobacter sp. MYb213]|uniref:transcriptional regulator n=1 Tax=Arthrobacter sp. MYb213 TaxID=1848595 RepID=UPI000CFD19E9|nr:transcriptional regulator [Arthrobacter sp. MYb213]PRB72587.1 MarR family transcriptional regulator [Arthrobacter sp. MYb213]
MHELDPVIHAQARLRTVTVLDTLRVGDRISFPKLQGMLTMTSGNLATHLRKLEDSQYVAVEKILEGRNPVTYVCLTRTGRTAFENYKSALRELLDPARSKAKP